VLVTKKSEIFHQSVWDFFPQIYLLREANVSHASKRRKKSNGKKIESKLLWNLTTT